MDTTTKIVPFWNRIPKFFLYGLHPIPLFLAASLLVISFILNFGLINLVFYVVGIKYGAEVLKRTMEGELTPPPLSYETINENFQITFKLFVVIFCYFFVMGNLFTWLNIYLGVVLYIIALLLLPAVVISLVISEEIGHALNPLNWLNIAFSVGWPYLAMVLFLFLLNIINGQFAVFVAEHLPERWLTPFLLVVNTYFMTVMFNLMGYVVFQYHKPLGMPTPAALADAEQEKLEKDLITPQLKKFIDTGNVAAATAEFIALINNNPDDMEIRRKCYVYLKSNGQHETLKEFALRYFGGLIDRKRYTEATNIYQESIERGAPIVPESSGDYLPVVLELRRRRAHKQAVALAQGFHKRFPKDMNTPALYMELAKILSEDLQRDDLAKQALQFVIGHFPAHELTPAVRQYLGLLNQLQQGAPAS